MTLLDSDLLSFYMLSTYPIERKKPILVEVGELEHRLALAEILFKGLETDLNDEDRFIVRGNTSDKGK